MPKPKSAKTRPTALKSRPVKRKAKKKANFPKAKLNEDAEPEAETSFGSASPAKACSADSFLRPLLKDVGWVQLLSDTFEEESFKLLDKKVKEAYAKSDNIFPAKENIFHAFNITPLSKVKVIILGQDPYHDDGQAHGLSFSVPRGMKIPPSLRNLYKELSTDCPGFSPPQHGCLEEWAPRGVLLLNATLTVEAHKANSHAQFGWQTFTDRVIQALSDHLDGVVFILWGGFAQKKKKLIDGTKHRIIETAHPSPLSCKRFYGCKCFSKTNNELQKLGKKPIDWSLSG